MSESAVLILIIAAIILFFILWKLLKPYVIRYNNALAFTGEIGTGKTLSAVKQAQICIRKNIFFHYKMHNYWKVKRKNWWLKIFNTIRTQKNKSRAKHHKQLKPLWEYAKPRKKPILYSNIPIHYKEKMFSNKRVWSAKLDEYYLTCMKQATEYCVWLLDEMPQFINQFNWDQKIIQDNVNEMITFFRHYYGGYLIITAQSTDDIVCQIRRKMGRAVLCMDFKKHLFGLFYTIRMCDMVMQDNVTTISTTQLDENTKLHVGLFPPKGTYDSRCFSERINNSPIKVIEPARWNKLKTNDITRLMPYKSPLDDKTTPQEKQIMLKQIEKITNKEQQHEKSN